MPSLLVAEASTYLEMNNHYYEDEKALIMRDLSSSTTEHSFINKRSTQNEIEWVLTTRPLGLHWGNCKSHGVPKYCHNNGVESVCLLGLNKKC